ncbi:MAG: leucine-rich repeat domain-containing protein [Bacteroidia bacterium]
MSDLALARIRENKTRHARGEDATSLNLARCGLTDWPDELFDCVWLEELILSDCVFNHERRAWEMMVEDGPHNELSFIDPRIVKLKNLRKLYAGGGGFLISDFDETLMFLDAWKISDITPLAELLQLQSLYICTNELKEIRVLSRLTKLETLNLSGNELIKVDALSSLMQLQTLDLSSNQLIEDRALAKLTQLQYLDLSANQLTEVSGLAELTQLEYLDLRENQLTEVSGLAELTQLQFLDLGENQLTRIDSLFSLTRLQTLYLYNNKLTDITVLSSLAQLKYLDLEGNRLTNIDSLSSLTELQHLDLSEDHLTNINSLSSLKQLQHLDLRGNKLSEIGVLSHLTQLQTLDLRNNRLTEIGVLSHLTQLKTLNLSSNQLSEIGVLSHLTQLQRLELSYIKLTTIPRWLIELPVLNLLNLYGTPVNHLPYEIINQGNRYNSNCLSDLRNWFYDLEQGSVRNEEIKIMVVGNGRVGKSCIIERLAKGTYTKDKKSTHAIQLETWETKLTDPEGKSKPVTLNFWDFGGQDIYHGTHRIFMQSRALFLLVWDWEGETEPGRAAEETQAEGYLHRNQPLPHWLDYIRSLSKQSPVIVVQNKVDQHRAKPVPHREVMEGIYKVFDYFSASAETARGIEDLKSGIFDAIQTMPEWDMEMPASWHNVRQAVRDFAKEKTDISRDEFGHLCKKHEVREVSQPSLLRYLHDTGVLFYQEKLFHDRIILNQQWAIEAVYTLFKRDKWFWRLLNKGNGQFNFEELSSFWRDEKQFDESQSQVALSFMLSCEICFRLNKDKPNEKIEPIYVAPQLLPEKFSSSVQTFWQDKKDGLFIRFQYTYLHEVFIQRFIVRAGHLALPQHLWRRGIWFTWDHTHAQIFAHYEGAAQNVGGYILIQVSGPRQAELLHLIRKEFTQIHPKELTYETSISLNGKTFISLVELEKCKLGNLNEIVAQDGSKVNPSDFGDFFYDPEKISGHSGVGKNPEKGIKDLKADLAPALISPAQKREWKMMAANGQLGDVLTILMDIVNSNDVLVLVNRNRQLKDRISRNTISEAERLVEENKIFEAVIGFIDSL